MWNLLAGYTGLMSLGPQLFVALEAYALFESTQRLGIAPWWGLPLAGLAGAVGAALLAPVLFRLRDAYFAIGLCVNDCREPVRPGRAVEPDERPFARNL